MSLLAGSVIAKFQSDLAGLKSGISEAQGALGGLKSKAQSMGESIKSSFDGFMNAAKIAGAVATGAFTLFAKSSMDLKAETDKAIISLDIIAERFKQNGKLAGELAVSLGKDLRIGTGAAADALQNLIKSGLNLDQASDLLKRFTNEAMTGKSESISLADAVKNLSFAYATNNSALGNLSGISENWSNITEKGKGVLTAWNGKANESAGITEELAGQIKAYEAELKKQGKTLSASDDEMAKYVGLLQLTNLTQGSAARFQGTYTDNLAIMTNKVNDVKLALGTLLQNALNPLVIWFTNSGILEYLERFIVVLGNIGSNIVAFATGAAYAREELAEALTFFTGDNWATANTIAIIIEQIVTAFKALGDWIVANQELVIAFLQGLAIALGALVIIGTIIGLINLLLNPITLIVLAVAALYTAWSTNFLGIQDITTAVFNFIMEIVNWFVALWRANWDNIKLIFQVVINFIQAQANAFRQFWATWGDLITAIARTAWELIKGAIQLAVTLIIGILTAFIALITGDWSAFWQAIKNTTQNAWNIIVNMFNAAKSAISDAMNALYNIVVGKLEEIWNKAKEIAGKIKDALSQISPFHKSSPSLVEYVQMGTGIIADTYKGLENTIAGMDFKSHLMTMVDGMQFNASVEPAGARVVQQNINATLTDGLDVQTFAEQLAFKYRNENI